MKLETLCPLYARVYTKKNGKKEQEMKQLTFWRLELPGVLLAPSDGKDVFRVEVGPVVKLTRPPIEMKQHALVFAVDLGNGSHGDEVRAILSFATKMVPSQTRCAPASDVCTCGLTRGSAKQ